MAKTLIGGIDTEKKSYGPKADAHLSELYALQGLDTVNKRLAYWQQLSAASGHQDSFHAMGVKIVTSMKDPVIGDCPVTDEMKLGAYEYEYLENEGLITPTLA
jgi:hypothetical protein